MASKQHSKHALSRRTMLKTAAAGTALHILPGCATGRDGNSPNGRLNLGIVGTGGQGIVNAKFLLDFPDVQITAICDVNRSSDYSEFYFGGEGGREPAKALIESAYAQKSGQGSYAGLKSYVDFNEMLDREDGLDAVLVATPDNLHAAVAMAAMRKRKHVYCEKPLTKTVYESRVLAQTAQKYGLATQMGNQGQASESTRRLAEYVADGAIGDVIEVHSWTHKPDDMWRQGIGRPTETPPVYPGLDWDRWLGPAPYRPYHPYYAPFRWRGWCDFGTGALGDIGCHNFHPVFRALQLVHPISVEATSTEFNRETYPLAETVTYQFPARGAMPPVKVVWYDGGLRPATPPELEGRTMPDEGTMLVGTEGKILDGRIIPLSRMAAYPRPAQSIERSPGHHREWVNACFGGPPAGSDFREAGPLTEVVLLGTCALKAGKKLQWDPENLRFPNAPEADQYLHRDYREGWSL